jgi:hypothetical protein
MSDNFTQFVDNYLTVRAQVKEKINGVVTYRDLGIEKCATDHLNLFFEPGPSSQTSFNYIRRYKHIYCLDDWAKDTIKPTLYGSS